MTVEIWAAGAEDEQAHASPPGPWSGHTESLHWSVRLAFDGDAFTIAFTHANTHRASNRGSREETQWEFTGTVSALDDGARLLRATHRVLERHEYHEPMEDMWTPPIDEVSAQRPGPLGWMERFALRAARSPDGTELRLSLVGENPGPRNLELAGGPLRRQH